MFKLSNLFENSVTKVGGAQTSKFGPIPQFGDFRSKFSSSPRSPESENIMPFTVAPYLTSFSSYLDLFDM